MDTNEIIISRLNKIIRDSQELIMIIKSKPLKPRSDRIYLSNADKQRAYRKRKKGLGSIPATQTLT